MNESLYSVQLIRVYEKNPEQLKELIASEEEPSLSDLIQVRKKNKVEIIAGNLSVHLFKGYQQFFPNNDEKKLII